MYRKVILRLPLDITMPYGLWTVKLDRLNIDVFLALCHLKKIVFQAIYQHIIFTWLRIVNDQYLDKRREIPLEFRELPKIMEMRGMWHLNNGITKSSEKWGLEPNFTCLYCRFTGVQLFATPWTVAHQAPLSLGFSRQEYWSGLPCPPPGDLPDPGIKLVSFTSPALAGGSFTTSATWEAQAKLHSSYFY